MPRANRISLPGHIWHITHRCHHREFLLKFARDRKCWRQWLLESRRRYGLCVLNYVATSNHIHLLVKDLGKGEITKSMQLIAGCTAQAYNRRKQRRGAYWEDRYHATAVDSHEYLAQCMVYIDLNLVRAGAVSHPAEWDVCGYREIHHATERNRIIDIAALANLLDLSDEEAVQREHKRWVAEALEVKDAKREKQWSDSVAVGSREFVTQFQTELGIRALHREIDREGNAYHLREDAGRYITNFLG
jgi:putative transposase